MSAARLALAALGAAGLAWAAASTQPSAFSAVAPGEALPPGWKHLTVPPHKANTVRLVATPGATVLESRARAAAGTAGFALEADPARTPVLAWKWKVDRVISAADLRTKKGDDFAARVYATFDVPAEGLGLATRAKIRLARILHGVQIPTAALCYVWDNRHPEGTIAPSAYTERVRVVVARSGGASVGEWVAESRDLEADFRAAFPEWRGPVPRLTGIAAGNDTDQTGETATAWFGDFRLEARR